MAATKGQARPKRRKAVRKESNINIRATPEQKAELSVAAAHAGVSVSSWMLALALQEARNGAK